MKIDLSVKFAGRLKKLANVDKKEIYNAAYELAERHSKFIDGGKLSIYITQRNEKTRQVPLFYCRANYSNSGNQVVASGSEYGITPTLNKAFGRIQDRLVQKKEKAINRDTIFAKYTDWE
ncbi:hypothetical protein J4413_04245 [Candidatus Woesearchaeota archaeon]|nr:hypothetical protein [Candidatus Woesearchaeota archaeon]